MEEEVKAIGWSSESSPYGLDDGCNWKGRGLLGGAWYCPGNWLGKAGAEPRAAGRQNSSAGAGWVWGRRKRERAGRTPWLLCCLLDGNDILKQSM